MKKESSFILILLGLLIACSWAKDGKWQNFDCQKKSESENYKLCREALTVSIEKIRYLSLSSGLLFPEISEVTRQIRQTQENWRITIKFTGSNKKLSKVLRTTLWKEQDKAFKVTGIEVLNVKIKKIDQILNFVDPIFIEVADLEDVINFTKLALFKRISSLNPKNMTLIDSVKYKTLSPGEYKLDLVYEFPERRERRIIQVIVATTNRNRTNNGNYFLKEFKTLSFTKIPSLLKTKSRVILTWGASPADLDLHAVDSNGNHVYSQNKNKPTNSMWLDVDSTAGFGPESITFELTPGVSYWFYVHNFSGEASLISPDVTIEVFGIDGIGKITQEKATYTNFGEGLITYWNLFKIIATQNKPSVQIVNQLVYDSKTQPSEARKF